MNFLKVAIIILFVILTIFTVKIHPGMHQPMIIEDADFVLTRISDTVKDIPVSTQTTTTVNTAQPVMIEKPAAPQTQKNIKITEPPKQPTQISDESQRELLQKIINNTLKQEELPQQPQKHEPPKQVEQPKPPKEQPKPVQHKNPYMTEQEEIIAWNKWRSNIQNQIMKDSEIDYAPLGTAFMFTFLVDKYGNISNIKVECSNRNYMDIARNNVKPAISRLQRKPILNFPRGTQRTSTVVTGLFLIGTQERFSTPDDFSDFERIKF